MTFKVSGDIGSASGNVPRETCAVEAEHARRDWRRERRCNAAAPRAALVTVRARRYKKTLVVVSHDRGFLNEVTTDIIHLHDEALHYYRGNFASFEEMYEQRRRAANKEFEKYSKNLKNAAVRCSAALMRTQPCAALAAQCHLTPAQLGLGGARHLRGATGGCMSAWQHLQRLMSSAHNMCANGADSAQLAR